MIRYWVPESPRWLMRMGRLEEARKSLAWALMVDPKEIDLPVALPSVEETRWIELFKYPKLCMAGMLTGLTQTGGFAIGVWAPTLLVLVLGASPEYAAFLMIFVNVSAVLGRFFITALIEPLGRSPEECQDPPVHLDAAARRGQKTGHDREQRRFACTVCSDEPYT